MVGPRVFSTGTILYGAAGASRAPIDTLEDARSHLRRMKAVGAFSVKSYNQPRRDQRQKVLQAARAFDMQVHYHDLRALERSDEGVYHATLDDMLPHCDFLSLHCNVTPDTRGVMNAGRFALLPDGAILVNAARGALVDDDALVAALTSGRLRAAGIDAYNNEPNVDPRLTALPNTFLMPHIGSATRETRDAMGFRALDNLDAFFAAHRGLLEWVRPRGGTTAFPWFADGRDARPFCEALARAGVLVAPGDCFGSKEHFRVGFAAETSGFADALAVAAEVLRGMS